MIDFLKKNIIFSCIAVIFLLVMITCIGTCNHYKNKAEVNRLKLRDTVTNFVVLRSKLKGEIAKQDQIITDLKTAEKSGLVTKKDKDFLKEQGMKKRDAIIIKLKAEMSILQEKLAYKEEPEIIERVVGVDTSSYMKVPQKFSEGSNWWSIHGTITKKNVLLDSMFIYSDPHIYIGDEKQGFLKKPKDKIIYTNGNPYISLLSACNVTIKKKKRLYQRGLVKFGLGVAVGFVIFNN